MEGETAKKNSGRRKIPIVKINEKKSLIVTFSKRRQGLFKKCKEVSILCGADIAALAFSPKGKPFSFGQIESILDRFLGRKYEKSEKLERWWDVPIDELGLDELKALDEFIVAVLQFLDDLDLDRIV